MAAAIPFSLVSLVYAGSWGLLRLTTDVDAETFQLGKLTQTWGEIEGYLRGEADSEYKDQTLEKIINHLYAKGTISLDLKNRLHQLRKQRNVSVHEHNTEEIDTLVEELKATEEELSEEFT